MNSTVPLKKTLQKVSKEPNDGYYFYNFTCANCGNGFTRYILKGIRAREVANMVQCDSCGCDIVD